MESMKDFEKELEASFRKIKEGDIIKGVVIAVSEEEIIVDLKYYTQGIIKVENYSDDPDFMVFEQIHEGDEIEACVIKLDDGEGNIELSMKEANDVLVWDRLEQMKQEEEVITVRIRESVPAGVIAYVEGVRAFIPASQITKAFVEDTEEWVGKEIPVQIITVDAEKKKVILSGKTIALEKDAVEHRDKVAMLRPGAIYEGVVASIRSFGVFVDIGDGITGLVHISQLSEKRVASPMEVVNIGDKVKVKLLDIKEGKVSLSIKEVEAEAAADELEELSQYTSKESASTSLASLLAGLKLD